MELNTDGSVSVLKLEGEIVFEKSNEIKEQAKELISDKEISELIIDLSRVDFLDSSGVGVLISLFKNIRERQGRLVLASPVSRVAKVFQLTRLGQIMDIYNDLEQARESFA